MSSDSSVVNVSSFVSSSDDATNTFKGPEAVDINIDVFSAKSTYGLIVNLVFSPSEEVIEVIIVPLGMVLFTVDALCEVIIPL